MGAGQECAVNLCVPSVIPARHRWLSTPGGGCSRAEARPTVGGVTLRLVVEDV
jgi:hypothetical protein